MKDKPPSGDEIQIALLKEVAEELHLSPLGVSKMPMHIIGKMICDRTGGVPLPEYIVTGMTGAWVRKGV